MMIIAHRGGGGLRVENTLTAFQNAIDVGADGAELDLRLTSDGEVIVHHDDHLNPGYTRSKNGRWLGERKPLASMSLANIQRYDIGTPKPGSAYADKFDAIRPAKGQTVPLLRDVIGLVQDASDTFFLVLEIKTPVLQATSRPWRELVDKALTVVDQQSFGDRFLLCSFDWGALTYAMTERPGTRTWFTTHPFSWYVDQSSECDLRPGSTYLHQLRSLYHAGDAPWYGGFDPRNYRGGHAQAIAAAGGDAWFMYYRDYRASTANSLIRHRLSGAAWSVNLRDMHAYKALADLGAVAACVDYPDIACSM